MDHIIKALEKEIEIQSELFNGACAPGVSLEDIENALDIFKKALFPGVFYRFNDTDITEFLSLILYQLKSNLEHILEKFNLPKSEQLNVSNQMIELLPQLKQKLRKDIEAIFDGDPAAETHEEVVLAYPSFEAIMIYRISHELAQLGVGLFSRMCASIAHRKTGIDIHPKAIIGEFFCIDHGTAIVIGETAVIGHHVKLYQGVTIGALSVSKNQKNKKRHPTIEDHVTIYARTTILGGDTVIGKHSIIGGNVWLTSSVPKNSKIYTKDYGIELSKPNT